jgi:NAD(P)H-nitrite reductase large subunit
MEADWLRELKASGVRLKKGVVLGRHLETSVLGIYGAGDAVETDNIRGSVFVGEGVVDPGVYLRMMRDQTDISSMINLVLHGTISHADLYPSVFKVAP